MRKLHASLGTSVLILIGLTFLVSAFLLYSLVGNHVTPIPQGFRKPKLSDFMYKFILSRNWKLNGTSELDSKTVFVITPTFKRPEQIAELTRLSQTLKVAENIYWIVVDETVTPSNMVQRLLNDSGLNFTYILAKPIRRYALKAKGVANRNAALIWIKENVQEGVFYFADDDNTYDYRLFREITKTERVSMFPVGLVTQLGISSPIVKNGKVVGFYDGWVADRKYPVDMAGFAVNVNFYLKRGAPFMPFKAMYEEDGFLKELNISKSEIQPLASNCTKLMVWHTKTLTNYSPKYRHLMTHESNSNIKLLLKELIYDGV